MSPHIRLNIIAAPAKNDLIRGGLPFSAVLTVLPANLEVADGSSTQSRLR